MFGRLLDRFKSLRAVVVGDLMLDEYIQGKATRISPEAPVMVVRHNSTKRVPGGAANVAQNIVALGASTDVIGVVGEDEAGDLLCQALVAAGLGEAQLLRDPDRKTTRKTRVLADHAHQVLRIDSEDDTPLSAEIEEEILARLKGKLKDANVLVLSDYLKGGLTAAVAKEAVAHAKALGVPVVVNPKPRSAANYAGADLISLNRAEAADALGLHRGLQDSQAEVAAGGLRDKLGSAALITLGESGMVAASQSRICRVQAPLVEVYDTAGAGDTVVAAAALGMAAVGFEKLIFELAAQTAACVVRHTGVVTPSAKDLAAIRAL
jgi:rfaE bifunctional protein kinase chain/domain